MISEVACEPEFPPLEMISGTKRARTTARAISFSGFLALREQTVLVAAANSARLFFFRES